MKRFVRAYVYEAMSSWGEGIGDVASCGDGFWMEVEVDDDENEDAGGGGEDDDAEVHRERDARVANVAIGPSTIGDDDVGDTDAAGGGGGRGDGSAGLDSMIDETPRWHERGRKKRERRRGGRDGAGNAARRRRSVNISIQLCVETSTGCMLSSNGLACVPTTVEGSNEGNGGGKCGGGSTQFKSLAVPGGVCDTILPDPPPALIKLCNDALSGLMHLLQSKACVDEYTADQLLIYMAFANGPSAILVEPVNPVTSSLHIDTTVFVIEKFFGAKFFSITAPIASDEVGLGCRLITCTGCHPRPISTVKQ